MRKTPATITAAGAIHYLEAIRKFCGELLLSLLETRQECGALDADNLGNRLIGQTVLTESADFDCFRHQLIQTGKELIELGFVADDLFNGRTSP